MAERRMLRIGLVAAGLYLTALLPCALGQRMTFIFDCTTKDLQTAATTNNAPTTIRAPENNGDCVFTLICTDTNHNPIDGYKAKIFLQSQPAYISFSCGEKATYIEIRATPSTVTKKLPIGKLDYTP